MIKLVHEYVFLNGEMMPARDARISAVSAAALYGKGVFTTIAVYSGEPFLWEKHWRRLEIDSEKLNIDLGDFSDVQTRKALEQLISKNHLSNGRARITFLDGSASKIWPAESMLSTNVLIATGDMRPVRTRFGSTISPYRVNSLAPLAAVKSCNYLEKLMALDEANGRGFDEAIMLNERGEVTSGVMANVFWIKDDVVYTPSLKTGCLAGTMREFVLENLDCREVEAEIDVLDDVDAIFLTSSGIGIVSVKEFGDRILTGIPHAITELM